MIDPRFAATIYRIEATSFERMTLLDNWSDKYVWEQDRRGHYVVVGSIKDFPVGIDCSWYVIHGHRVLFWDAVSSMVSHQMIENWFGRHCPCPSTNAMNFHNCILEIERRSKQ